MNAFYGSNSIDFTQAERTCASMNLCEGNESIHHLLLEEQPMDLDKHVEFVNSNPHSAWKAGAPKRFEGMSRKEIKSMMGTVVDPDWVVRAPHVKQVVESDMPGVIPTEFFVSTNWPLCATTVNLSRDQSNCGSCWAHGTTEAFNDRLCIATGGSFQSLLSVADTAGCCNGTQCLSYDCNGGQVATPWRWFKNKGVVSGGWFEQGLFCYDYTMAMCAHHVTSDTLPSCDSIVTAAPGCYDTCQTVTSIDYAADKKKTISNYGFGGNVAAIQTDIMTYGSVSAAFTVYEDFLTYTSGVYYH